MTKRRDDPSFYSASYSCCSLLLQLLLLLLPRVAIATTTPSATAFRGFCNISFNLIRVECRRRRLCSIVGRRFDLAAPVCERACCNRVACCSVCCLPSAGCRLRVAGCGQPAAGTQTATQTTMTTTTRCRARDRDLTGACCQSVLRCPVWELPLELLMLLPLLVG